MCVGWGLERSLNACHSDHSYAVYTKGLEMSWLVSVFLSFAYVFLAGVLKGVSVHVHIAVVLKELDQDGLEMT